MCTLFTFTSLTRRYRRDFFRLLEVEGYPLKFAPVKNYYFRKTKMAHASQLLCISINMVIASLAHFADTSTHKTLVLQKTVTNYHVHPDIQGCVCTFHDLDTVSLAQPVHICTFLIHLKLVITMLKSRNSKIVFRMF